MAFSTNFFTFKSDLSGNTIWLQSSGFLKLAEMDHFWALLNQILATQNANVARYVECDFFVIFKHRALYFSKCII